MEIGQILTHSATMWDALRNTPLSFGTQTAGTWVAVPEPTSGLLMLVGLGALALRRRRA